MIHLPYDKTPVYKLENLSKAWNRRIFIKRDDRFVSAYGGSKARILQYIMGPVKMDRTELIITAGGPKSNFLRAMAVMCAEFGIKLWVVSYSNNKNEYKSLNHIIAGMTNAEYVFCNKEDVPAVIQDRIEEASKQGVVWKYIYGGGEGSIEGLCAYYDAVKELYGQLTEAERNDISNIYLPCGTGTTTSGISCGMQDYFPNAIVHAISVARSYENEKSYLLNNSIKLGELKDRKYSTDNIAFHEEFIMGGYGMASPDLETVIREFMCYEGIMLDETYSGKAAFGMKRILENIDKSESIQLFWCTGGLINSLSRYMI